MKPDKKRAILQALVEGCSVRSAERMTGAHRDSILRLLVRAGAHCEAILDREIRDVCTNSIQCDELWTYCHTKERHLQPGDPSEWGDQYCFIALERESKMILAHDVDKRDDVTAHRFVNTLSRRVGGPVQIFADGWAGYKTAIPRYFGARANFAQVIKNYDADSDEHRYTPPRVTSITHNWVCGAPRTGLITTSHVERSNWNVRTYLRRFTRLSNGFSRKLANLRV